MSLVWTSVDIVHGQGAVEKRGRAGRLGCFAALALVVGATGYISTIRDPFVYLFTRARVTEADRDLLTKKLEAAWVSKFGPITIDFVEQQHLWEELGPSLTKGDKPLQDIPFDFYEKAMGRKKARAVLQSQLRIFNKFFRARPEVTFSEGLSGMFDDKWKHIYLSEQSPSKDNPLFSKVDEIPKLFQLPMPEKIDDLSESQKSVLMFFGGNFTAFLSGHIQKVIGLEPDIERQKNLSDSDPHFTYEVRETDAIVTTVKYAKNMKYDGPYYIIFGDAHRFEDYSRDGLRIKRVSP